MVLGPKSEERIKELLREYNQEQRQNLDRELTNATSAIFLWGFMGGIVISYTSLWPFLIGAVVGYCAAQKHLSAVNNIYRSGNEIIVLGYQRLTIFLAKQ